MDPKNNDPLNPDDFHPSSSASSGKKLPEDRKPHWDELGRGTSAIPKGAAEILKSYFDNQQINQAGEYHSFFSSWRDLAGLDLASHSTPRDIRNNTLIVDADHPGWVQMIYMKKKTILKNIRRRFPLLDINDLRVLYTSHPATTRNAPDSPETSPDRKPEENDERHLDGDPLSQGDSKSQLPCGKKTPDTLSIPQVQSQKGEKEEEPPGPKDESSEDDRLREALKRLGKHLNK